MNKQYKSEDEIMEAWSNCELSYEEMNSELSDLWFSDDYKDSNASEWD